MYSKRILIVSMQVILLVSLTSLHAKDVLEGWGKAKVGTYPIDYKTLIRGDAVKWIPGATVDGHDDPDDEWPCGPCPHTVEIIEVGGDKKLRLISGYSDGGCADNVWITPINSTPTLRLQSDTIIAFEAEGELDDPQTAPWGTQNCVVPPCYDNISVQIEVIYDNMRDISDLGLTENDLWDLSYDELMEVKEYLEGGPQPCLLSYVVRCNPNAVPNTSHSTYREIWLDPSETIFVRNLYEDFLTIPAFESAGAKISSIEFSISEHGWGTIDNIYIGDNDIPEPPEPPDLTGMIGAVKLPPSVVAGDGTKGKITVVVVNQGTDPVAKGQNIAVRIMARPTAGGDDIDLLNPEDRILSISNLKAGKSKKFNANITIPADFPEGAYQIIADIDANDDVVETDETNNLIDDGPLFSVLPPFIDLQVDIVKPKLPSSVIAGDGAKIKLPVSVANNGNVPVPKSQAPLAGWVFVRPADALDNSQDIAIVDSPLSVKLNNLKPEKSKKLNAQVTIPAEVPEGSYHLAVLIESPVSFDDPNPNNNWDITEESIYVITGTVDLNGSFGNVKVPAQIQTGSDAKAKVPIVITNNGNIPTEPGHTVQVRIVARPQAGGDDRDMLSPAWQNLAVSNLKPGKSKTYNNNIMIPDNLSIGNYTIVAIFDILPEIVGPSFSVVE